MINEGICNNENAKGVIQLSSEINFNKNTPFQIYGINIIANPQVINELKKYTKGFFFVRQKRIPLTLAQGIVIGLDKESRTPTIPTLSGVIQNINYEKSFIETSDINDINYVSEGFLSRYYFTIDKKPTGVWKKVGIALAVIAILAAAVCATVFTLGAGGLAVGAGFAFVITTATSSTIVATGAALTTALTVVGYTVGAAVVAGVLAGGIAEGVLRQKRTNNKEAAMAVDGRNEKIPEGYERNEKGESRQLIHDLAERYIIKDASKNSPDAIIVPDYQVNQPYYN
jgi:hypothetical protein